jgi:hypothetical protein
MPLGAPGEGWRLACDLLPLPLLFAILCVAWPVAVGGPAPWWAAVGAIHAHGAVKAAAQTSAHEFHARHPMENRIAGKER